LATDRIVFYSDRDVNQGIHNELYVIDLSMFSGFPANCPRSIRSCSNRRHHLRSGRFRGIVFASEITRVDLW